MARDRLATAADRAVVAPNNDTLYASGWFDLAAGDVTVEAGAMAPPDRYWSAMLLDAYTHVAYVCRRLHGHAGARVRVTYDPATPPVTDRGADVLTLGTPTVWVLVRVLVDAPRRPGRRPRRARRHPGDRPRRPRPRPSGREAVTTGGPGCSASWRRPWPRTRPRRGTRRRPPGSPPCWLTRRPTTWWPRGAAARPGSRAGRAPTGSATAGAPAAAGRPSTTT